MTTLTGRYTPSVAGGQTTSSSVTFGANVNQAPVFLSGRVIPSQGFARLMMTLGNVVRLDSGVRRRDHSAYQSWVRGEYLKELVAGFREQLDLIAELTERRLVQANAVKELEAKVGSLWPEDPLWQQRRSFWRWLWDHDREAWVVLDPIVSVQPDAVFFEAFSQDESVYARVRLPIDAIHLNSTPRVGTTNIDYSVALEREFARTRPYRPLHLTVGAESVGASTEISSITERKIELPDSWVQGLVEVQAALGLTPVELSLSAGFVADVIARVESEREKTGPRALSFHLEPNEPVRVEVQPWGEFLTDPTSLFQGDGRRCIRVWGRRRLGVIADVLPNISRVRVQLIDDGMPSFWTVEVEGVALTVGLSGWSSQDWAGRARFSAMTPAYSSDPKMIDRAVEALRTKLAMNIEELSRELNVPPTEARGLLQALCVAGQAMYDVESSRYRWRALFPDLELQRLKEIGREERKGVELAQSNKVQIAADEVLDRGLRRVSANVDDVQRANFVVIETDLDGRVSYAQCDCSHFRFHKLRQGPCRHIVATSIQGATI